MTALSRPFAEGFARDWLAAWNDRDIERILAHYSEDIIFHSPRIAKVLGNEAASVFGKQALRDYWTKALGAAPQLFFELDEVLIGSDALTILYTNHRDELVAETFVFGPEGKVVRSIAVYR
ncbi:nuclear transport factor 2 family protein [Hyphomonas sediminis]|uniref:nuclear transport factor 2 family protein n=1 Tax=Hyphomonas sediminis TaxID=2866160 RepID=UPI001CEDB8F5|nr:nuclear transport factor 2 family protein [Hyphomonas sediminis]